MRRAAFGLVLAIALIGLPVTGAAASKGALEMYSASVDAEQLETLTTEGYDVAAVEPSAKGAEVDLVLAPGQRGDLAREGIEVEPLLDPRGRTVSERARAQAAGGFEVWRDWDGSDGLARELHRFARRHRDIAELYSYGETIEGRKLLAVRLTEERRRGRRGDDRGRGGDRGRGRLRGDRGRGRSHGDRGRGHHRSKPAVLYQGTTHAREWISTEVTMRLMRWFADNREQRRVRRILRTRELWFAPVVNPDGYQYTFDHERLWRKNLRDTNGDGEISVGDGIDLNRNYPERWRYDDEGSSTQPSDETYRGTEPASEPETRGDIRLVRKVDPTFAVSYHSYGPLLLYPQGWQVQSPVPDDPIYIALSGTDEEPAVEGFDPDVAAELYTTNGEFTDWAHNSAGALAWTPELEEGCEGCGFVFPDDEALVQRQFEINRPFALDLARSARHPERPKSHLGNRTRPMYLQTVGADPTRANNPASDFRFDYSYGSRQPVQVLARKSLRSVRVRYRINDGRVRSASTRQWKGGETYGEGYDRYYEQRRGVVEGADAGDTVEVWFEGRERGGRGHRGKDKRTKETAHFSYDVVESDPADVLIVAAEDYSGASNSPAYPSDGEPSYLKHFQDSLDAAGLSHDVYDVDARGRTAPDALGVLGHYDAVVHYTGNDVITREPDGVPGGASRLANDEMLELRSYLNEGGKLLYNGQYAGYQYAFGYAFDPVANEPCFAGDDAVDARCQLLSDDFLQYYLGAYIYNDGAGSGADGPLPVAGTGNPFEGAEWTLNGGNGADNQEHTASLLSTSSLLGEDTYPQFASDAPAAWVRAGAAPFEPFAGSQYAYSNRASQSYKRLQRSFDLTAVGAGEQPTLDFRISYDTEPAWDHVIVEARPVGSEQWTTLPDANGHTSTEPGQSCAAGWRDLHPFLDHYQTLADGSCEPTGTSGEWHSASGRSNGWEPWSIDLSDYAGQEVEVSITYVSDWAVQGLGAFVDEVETSFGEGTTSFEDDADPMDGWTVPGPPAGSGGNGNDWERTGSVGFEEGAVTSTEDSLYFAFGFEGITSAAERDDVMRRSMRYLLGPG